MSTSGQDEGPRYSPYAQQSGPQGGGQPGHYGSPPPYGQPGQYAYNPYSSSPYPAGLGDSQVQPARRPGIMVLSLVLLVLSTLVFLLVGVVFLAVPLDPATIAPVLARVDPTQQLNPEQVILVIRIVGGVFAAFAALYILFASLAFTGRNWARIAVTVLTVGFVLLLVAGLVSGGATDGISLAVLAAILVAAVAGTVILYLPDSRRYFANPRR